MNCRVTPEVAEPLLREGVGPEMAHPPRMALLVADVDPLKDNLSPKDMHIPSPSFSTHGLETIEKHQITI
jgi:hypothetical protein